MDFQNKLKDYIMSLGVSDVGFAHLDGDESGMKYGISLVVHLSEAVIDEIGDAPTHTYFHHYRTVNAFLDNVILRTGMFLQENGYNFIPVGASQSINKDGWNYKGRISSRKVACLAGLGRIGKNSVFIHKKYGPAVRLGTILTDCEFSDVGKIIESDLCTGCGKCVEACPAHALKGVLWEPNVSREEIIDVQKCSEYMKKEFKNIGRGAVCGICINVCPLRLTGKLFNRIGAINNVK